MPSTFVFVAATLLLSLNFVRPLGLAVSDWLYFGSLGLAFIETFLIERRHLSCWWRNRFLWAVVLILFGAILSTMRSRHWGVALIELVQQIFVVTLFISLTWIMVRRGKLSWMVLAFIFSGVFTAGVVLIDYFTGSNFGPILSGTSSTQIWGRYAGTLGHPNKLGCYLVLTALLSLGQLLTIKPYRGKNFVQLIWVLLIAVQLFGIYLSGSMTAYVGGVFGIVVFYFSSRFVFIRNTRTLRALAVASVLVILFSIITSIDLIDSSFNLANSSFVQAFNRVQTSTARSRLFVYKEALDQIARNPWFGVGYDQLSTSGIGKSSRYLTATVHNPLLQIWYAGGLLAFIGWLAIYFSFGWSVLSLLVKGMHSKIPLQILALSAAALSILLMDQFQDAVHQREKWLVIGLLAGWIWDYGKRRSLQDKSARLGAFVMQQPQSIQPTNNK